MPTGVYIRTPEYREKQRQAMLRRINPGKFKSEETKKRIGDAQRGKPKSEEFKTKCRERMKGISFFKGHKQSEYQRQLMREKCGERHYNWKGGIARDKNKYNISLRRLKNGWTRDLFDEILKKQNNECAICRISLITGMYGNAASADHCHTTNIPRGILCKRCNLMLGLAKDNIDTLSYAIAYLKMWKRTA